MFRVATPVTPRFGIFKSLFLALVKPVRKFPPANGSQKYESGFPLSGVFVDAN